MNTPASTSLSFVLPREGHKVVILRRGPSRYVRCILWDRNTDTFEDGQWIKGSIKAEDCDLTADGKHLLFLVNKNEAGRGSWHTAISRPPWFTALTPRDWENGNAVKARFLSIGQCLVSRKPIGDHDLWRIDGIEMLYFAPDHEPGAPTFIDRKRKSVRLTPEHFRSLFEKRDHVSDIGPYVVQGGRLFRKDAAAPDGLSLVRDFSDMDFERIRAPYDDRTEREPDNLDERHLLDGEDAP